MTNNLLATMINKSLSIAEAKAHFSECIENAVNEGYVLITRYGKPIAAIVDLQDLEQLMRLRSARETGTLANLSNDWEDADEFAQILDEVVQER